MDGNILTVIGSSAVLAAGIAIGRQMNIRGDISRLSRKLHDIEDWRNATLPKEYVQQRELALTLKPIVESIARIETNQVDMASDLKAVTRWVDQHGPASA